MTDTPIKSEHLEVFVGNPEAYATQNSDGSYTPIRKPLNNTVLRQHLSGAITVGTYVNVGDLARFIVFDIDTGSLEETQKVYDACVELGVPERGLGIEFSGRKGYHVWVLLNDLQRAETLRRFGRAVLALAGVRCEVFPKQDEARDLGNLVKLPGALHRVSNQRSKWVSRPPTPLPVATWQREVVPNLPHEVQGRRFDVQDNRFPCIEAIQNEGCNEGGRNNQLFHLATMLRRAGATGETVDLVIRHVNEKNDPPLDDFELEQLLMSSSTSGPVCDQVPEARHCGELCIKTRTKGLYTRPGQLRHAAEGESVVVTLGSRAGQAVTLEHDDLEQAKGRLRDAN